MSLTYGFDVKSHEDPFLSSAAKALALMESVTVPNAFLVNTFPICKNQDKLRGAPTEPYAVKHMPSWLPGAQFKRIAEDARKDFEMAVDGPLGYVKEGLKVGFSPGMRISLTTYSVR